MEDIIEELKDIRQSRIQGNSVVITMTGFLEANKYYSIVKNINGDVIINEVEFKRVGKE